MRSFRESVCILRMADASFFAADLFNEAFASPFPNPRDGCGVAIPTPPNVWNQYIALYKWSEVELEPVAFANFLRHRNVYLEGGLCARRSFYRRLPEAHWEECKRRGGIVQVLLERAAEELDDAVAWFGYCGDRKSWLVNQRIGYQRTRHPYLIVKWYQTLPTEEQHDLIEEIAGLGSF
jgi:hypothetical protein